MINKEVLKRPKKHTQQQTHETHDYTDIHNRSRRVKKGKKHRRGLTRRKKGKERDDDEE